MCLESGVGHKIPLGEDFSVLNVTCTWTLHLNMNELNIFVCREPCYPDFTPLEDWMVREGKLERKQIGWYATKHGPVDEFIAEPTRRVYMSDTTPPKPFVVDWRLRPVDVLCPFLPTDPKKEVISIKSLHQSP